MIQFLEDKLRSNLHLAHVGGCPLVSSECRGCERVGELGEVAVIQNIKHFPSQQQAGSLSDLVGFAEGEVQVLQAREIQLIASAVSRVPEQWLSKREIDSVRADGRRDGGSIHSTCA